MFVPQLDERSAVRDGRSKLGERAATGDSRIDKRVESEIDGHQFTFARAETIGPSRL
jgi:hypothetical protein